MDGLLNSIVRKLNHESKPVHIDELVNYYLLSGLALQEDSIEFSSNFKNTKRKIVNLINSINKKFSNDKLDEPFIMKGYYNDIIHKNHNFYLLSEIESKEVENYHDFAKRVSYSMLKILGCKQEDIHIDKMTRDGGIDYWAIVNLNIEISSLMEHVLIIGQVKNYSGVVSVNEIREFIGAIVVAFETSYFGEEYNKYTPHIVQLITTGELTSEAKKVADAYKIIVITKRHLKEMKILIPD